ncbi:THAP domain-containing protein 3-like [Pieris napi]|uniref:THAP domain-containing protein 3-like n=1 Tax=Pieris napi TaxID=78633 RepID=UPI001FB964BB|nr:THAP domain-containing protein 3-like [Pieris napi]
MPKCAFNECRNVTSRLKKSDGISYFRFPRNPIQCAKWALIVGRQRNQQNFKPNRSSVVCSEHFRESDLYVTDKGIKRILKTAVPKIDLTEDDDESTISEEITDSLLLDIDFSDLIDTTNEIINNIPDDIFRSAFENSDESSKKELTPRPADPTDMIYFQGELDKRRKRIIEKEKVVKKRNYKNPKKTSLFKTTLKKLKKKLRMNARLRSKPVKSISNLPKE